MTPTTVAQGLHGKPLPGWEPVAIVAVIVGAILAGIAVGCHYNQVTRHGWPGSAKREQKVEVKKINAERLRLEKEGLKARLDGEVAAQEAAYRHEQELERIKNQHEEEMARIENEKYNLTDRLVTGP